ncbi:lysylphosphatidylglycerol synthase transmembrane domain-containing protein [Phycicoccus sonneratiae]|uniref:Flippase-like domain-containing protein n=1 Tax=Phycicoccus sonneratiae TaxID=2807628 RepID=A0ABS2CR54_9MICO|nr:lysylphosphatidylglycerol synthase domain-containing protein [Phycicoccus sonneraticus]MBM6402367.1 flippase-like domain-containing protein [Phycicoccus sonneraticus]
MTTVWGPGVRLAAGAALAAAVVAMALPRVTGTSWEPILAALTRPSPAQLGLLAALWLVGLWVHTPSLTAALPGLSHRRALLLNLSGSFVSNLLPLGGAAGTVVNWRMARGWGFGSAAFGRWALVTNLADTVVKLLLPGVVLCWVAVSGRDLAGPLTAPGTVGVALLLALVTGVVVLGRDDRAVRRLGRLLDRLAARLRPLPVAPEGWGERAARFRRDSAHLVRTGWARMLGGKVGYALFQALLLWACLEVVGAPAAPVVVASAFVVERLLSMLVITPGATGIVEVGMAGALTALGVPAAPAAAGVLLYRAFVVGMEVPVGGLALLGWWAGRRRGARAVRPVVRSHPADRTAGRTAHDARSDPTEGAPSWSTPVSAAPGSPSAG